MAKLVRSYRPKLVRSYRRPIFQRYMSMTYPPPQLDGLEPVEEYRPGGFHPISIGDEFSHGRYRVIHKLGFGGSSTIWLARDQQSQSGGLVTLKAMRADLSKSPNDLPEISIPSSLHAALPHCNGDFQTVIDHFGVQGPNGDHRILISPLAGPSVLAMSDSPGRVSGSRRLRKDLAVKVAKQTANAIYRMHTAGFVHGDLTTSNILFRFSENVFRWSDDEVYNRFGSPQTEEVWTTDGRLCKPNTPASLVQPIENSKITDSSLLEESIVIIDFGQSYAIDSPPNDYQPGTIMNYLSPETRFEGRAGLQAEIWALGCAIFEIRAGSPLFDKLLGSDIDVLKQTVETLGRLPDPWWGSFVERMLWFEEDGEPKTVEAQERAGLLLKSFKTSIREKLRTIGTQDDPPYSDEGSMVENAGVMLCEEEVELLGGLLDRLLKYLPEERIGIEEVVQHSWFEMNSPSKR